MYSGIIYEKGEIVEIKETLFGLNIEVKSSLFDSKKIGNSFAIDGICLTQVDWKREHSFFDVSKETILKTTIGTYYVGQKVHLEKPLSVQDELGGHVVQGHVDGIAEVVTITPEKLVVKLPESLSIYAISKGSIAIDGVSLTIAYVEDLYIEIALIPHTYENTLFKEKEEGSFVNIEIDIFAKMMFKYLDKMDLKKVPK